MLKRVILVSAVVLFVQTLLFGSESVSPKINKAVESVPAKAGTVAADFELPDLKGKKISFSSFKDKPVVLFFWTTWCPHCRKQIKYLSENRETLAKDGLEVLAIDVGEVSYKVENFAQVNQITFPILLDKDGIVADSYDVAGVPTVIVLNNKGKIVFRNSYFPQEYKNLLSM